MKYKTEVIIDVPRDKVVEYFDSAENLKEWQPGFVSMELISGNKGEVGSKYRMKYKMRNREVEMIETITRKELPERFDGTYEAKGVWNLMENHFEELPEGKTRWWSDVEFRFKGFMKIMGWLMPGAFRKQSQKYADLFKEYVEREEAKN